MILGNEEFVKCLLGAKFGMLARKLLHDALHKSNFLPENYILQCVIYKTQCVIYKTQCVMCITQCIIYKTQCVIEFSVGCQ